MAVRFRIHPAIGVARVGDALATSFFIGPEAPGRLGGEPPGTRVPPYKDGGRIKPQAARFRVWAYTDVGGRWRPHHEVLPGRDGVAEVRWTVHLANRKAAFVQFSGRYAELGATGTTVGPYNVRRNGSTPAARLTIDPRPRTIAGRNRSGVIFRPGGVPGESWPVDSAGTPVIDYLGELRTDGDGRLIVIGGKGRSASNKSPPTPLTNFANNRDWFDDVSDGPVTAEITFSTGAPPATAQGGAWVLVAPPDFAPELDPVVTLYDLLFDMAARQLTLPSDEAIFDGPLRQINRELQVLRLPELRTFKPEFNRDVYPILARAASVGWVFEYARSAHTIVGEDPSLWAHLSRVPVGGSDPDAAIRMGVFNALRPPPGFPRPTVGNLRMPKLLGDDTPFGGSNPFLTLTPTQYLILKRWRDGQFLKAGPTPPPPGPATITPEGLDRAALERCVGGAFVPGIEVGWQIRAPTIFESPFRIRHRAPSRHRADPPGTRVEAGYFSRQMALPWQADFLQCFVENHRPAAGATPEPFGWWPHQRPVHVFPAGPGGAASATAVLWHRPAAASWPGGGTTMPSSEEMVAHWSKFGFVVKRGASFVEEERSPGLP